MKLELYEAVEIINHEISLLQTKFDYKSFLILQLATEELERILLETNQIIVIE